MDIKYKNFNSHFVYKNQEEKKKEELFNAIENGITNKKTLESMFSLKLVNRYRQSALRKYRPSTKNKCVLIKNESCKRH